MIAMNELDATSTDVALGIIELGAKILGVDGARPVPALDAALDRDLFGEGLEIGGRHVDSLELVEILAAVEAELDVMLFEATRTGGLRTLREIGRYVVEVGDVSVIERFTHSLEEEATGYDGLP